MQRFLTIICSFIFVQTLLAQTPSDFYFVNPLPEQSVDCKKSPAKFIGRWQSKKDTMRTLVITENKIYYQYKHLMILSDKELKNAGYSVKDNFVYGFSKTDSLPAIVKNDTIIFCYISEHEIIHYVKETGNEFLTEIGGGLILSQKQDSLYSYTLITIKKDELILSEVDHETQLEKVIKQCKPEISYNSEAEPILYVSDLNKKEMEKFISSGFFNEIQHCSRIIE